MAVGKEKQMDNFDKFMRKLENVGIISGWSKFIGGKQMELVERLRTYAASRKGELAELVVEAADALEVKNSDCISRQGAIDALIFELGLKPKNDEGLNAYDIKAVLNELPSIE